MEMNVLEATSAVAVSASTFRWKIEKWESVKELWKVGQRLFSPTFDCGGIHWNIWVYPVGAAADNEGFLSIFVGPVQSTIPPKTSVQCALEFRVGGHEVSFTHAFDEADCLGHGQAKFLRTSDDRLNVDTLVISVDLTFVLVPSSARHPPTMSVQAPKRTLDAACTDFPKAPRTLSFAGLIDTGLLSDVTFSFPLGEESSAKGDNEPLRAHKCILAATSPVFRAMLCGPTLEAAGRPVEIVDVPRDVMQDVLRFIYTGRCPSDRVEQLAVAADKYDLAALRTWCERKLARRLNADCAVRLLLLADTHGYKKLKQHVMSFLETSFDAVFASPSFLDLTRSPELFSEVQKLKCSKLPEAAPAKSAAT